MAIVAVKLIRGETHAMGHDLRSTHCSYSRTKEFRMHLRGLCFDDVRAAGNVYNMMLSTRNIYPS